MSSTQKPRPGSHRSESWALLSSDWAIFCAQAESVLDRAVGVWIGARAGWSRRRETLVGLGIGLTDVVKRPTGGIHELTTEEFHQGAQVLRKKIVRYTHGSLKFLVYL